VTFCSSALRLVAESKNTLRDPAFQFPWSTYVIPTRKSKFDGRGGRSRAAPDAELRHYDAMSLKYIGNHGPTVTRRPSF